MNMEVDELNPFSAHAKGHFFKGGRRQELLQYVRHLSANLYDIVFISGATGVGKSTLLKMLSAYMRETFSEIIDIDAKNFQEAEQMGRLEQTLSLSLERSQGRVEPTLIGAAGAEVSDTDALPVVWLFADNAQVWSEASIRRLFDFVCKKQILQGSKGVQNRSQVRCILCADNAWVKQMPKWAFYPQLNKLSYTVEVQPLNLNESRRYLEFRLGESAQQALDIPMSGYEKVVDRAGGLPGELNRLAAKRYLAGLRGHSKKSSVFPKAHAAAIVCLVLLIAWLLWPSRQSTDVGNTVSELSGTQSFAENVQQDNDRGEADIDVAPDSNQDVADELNETADLDMTLAPEKPASLLTPAKNIEKRVQVESSELVSNANAQVQPEGSALANPMDTQLQRRPREEGQKEEVQEEAQRQKLTQTGYTIQLLAGGDLSAIKRQQRRYETLYGQEITLIERAAGDAAWYVLISGDYKTQKQAMDAINNLPQTIKDAQPWVRPNGALQP